MKPATHYRAFTLIELLLYVGLMSFLLFATSMVLTTLLEARVKNQTMSEVEGQGLAAMQTITQTIRNATSVTTPSLGATSTSLTLAVAAPNNPTIFTLSGGALQMTEGASSPVALTNTRVSVSGLVFKNLSRSGTSGVVRVEFTLTYVSSLSNYPYTYQKTFYGGAALHP